MVRRSSSKRSGELEGLEADVSAIFIAIYLR